ncbi:MAG TPA: thioredoxin domain-containing protein [Burkholderiales bacterium]|nr:thioredoxin domain-containing protein [Burkholderiales bacterium]
MPNRLATETSPYLQQHADNPVEWYPWGEEALELARRLDKPILLSIGYSACHWCHVMAHESFEDAQVAVVMNMHFVNVKVDREERPDLDQIYQTAHQMLTQRAGGWPLTMFLTPEGVPFFAGTYFPKASRYGMPGFADLLPRIAEAYRTQRREITEQNASLMDALQRSDAAAGGDRALQRGPVDAAVRELSQFFDDVHGGIGQAPKFPHPYELAFCLRRHALDGGALSGAIATLTLTKMAEGGLYDHLGGGFCRYSTDRFWAIPHFEKMLYDNGPLLALYADAWLHTREPLYERAARGTAEWVMREMHAQEGGYYSSLDADSEGEEGKFYVWTPEEAAALLTPPEYAVAAAHYGLDAAPNFENRYWHLRIAQPLPAVASALSISLDAAEQLRESARAKLYEARERRVHPGRDEKVLTSWNALMAKGMARAGRVFGRADWTDSAQRAVGFIRATLWVDGRLLATYKDGRAHLNAYLDDYAFLLDALLELLQTEFRSDDLAFARAVADALLQRFEDPDRGGFYFTSHDHEKLIHRPKTGHDGATPSGNGVAAYALQRLGHVLGEPRYLAAAERTLKAFYESLQRNASGHTTLATALEETLTPPRLVVLRGAAALLRAWHAQLAATYRPDTMVIAIASEATGVPPALDKPAPPAPHGVSAWLCEGVTCLPPVFEVAGMEANLVKMRGLVNSEEHHK